MTEDTVEVAVMGFRKHVDYESWAIFAQSITDWYECTQEEYVVLNSWINTIGGDIQYKVIVKMPTSEVPTTIAECMAKAKKHQEQLKKKAAERKAKAEKRRKEKAFKDKESKRKLLEELKKELGE